MLEKSWLECTLYMYNVFVRVSTVYTYVMPQGCVTLITYLAKAKIIRLNFPAFHLCCHSLRNVREMLRGVGPGQ